LACSIDKPCGAVIIDAMARISRAQVIMAATSCGRPNRRIGVACGGGSGEVPDHADHLVEIGATADRKTDQDVGRCAPC